VDHGKKPILQGKPDQLNSKGNLSLWGPPPLLSCNFESRDEILLKGGRPWRPRFLFNVINANGRISRVKPVDIFQTLGQPGSSPLKPHQHTLLTPLPKSTHICGQPLVKGMVKTLRNPNVFERPPELLPRSPNFT
jgi:hypothetical protein